MDRRLGAGKVLLRGVAPLEAPVLSNIVAMPTRRGRLRLIQGGAGTRPSEREDETTAGFQASVLIGWATDGTAYLDVNCLTGQHLQTLINAVMELEAVILDTRSKQEAGSGAPEIVETTPPSSEQ
jgi:hypothetical protein